MKDAGTKLTAKLPLVPKKQLFPSLDEVRK